MISHVVGLLAIGIAARTAVRARKRSHSTLTHRGARILLVVRSSGEPQQRKFLVTDGTIANSLNEARFPPAAAALAHSFVSSAARASAGNRVAAMSIRALRA
jgi:hypothetical protein